MTDNAPASHSKASGSTQEGLFQVLLDRDGVLSVVLATQDGIKLHFESNDSDFDDTQADYFAAIFTSLYGTVQGVKDLTGAPQAQLKHAGIQLDHVSLLLVGAGRDLVPPGMTFYQPSTDRAEVETCLGVLCTPGADEGAVGYEMGQLVRRMKGWWAAPVRLEKPGAAAAEQ
ncbi:hypothetical protein AB0I84_15760 [Streptomyces spectabilis]|uniref:roadblock/LC7 domain-containing protein n=1 Tax=Streptomyces spectabilis TaxID=68270 RepID=UPI0033E2C3FD